MTAESAEYDHFKLLLTPACRDLSACNAQAGARGAGRDDTIEITVFNRGIAFFMTDDDRVRRIHRVLCRLDKEQGGTRRDGSNME